MKNLYTFFSKTGNHLRIALLAVILFMVATEVSAQTPTVIPTGSFIVNMGITPQTTGNGLKPYGMLYDLLKNYQVPVIWVINSSKVKDGIDFSYNGTDFKGGPFIIKAEYRTTAVNARISYWQTQGVTGVTTTSPVTVPVYTTFINAPRWTLDKQNGSIAVNFFNYAGIPSTAYGGSSSSGWKLPSQLTCCDNIFVMPHADPTWATHNNLFTWNLTCKGAIWLGCHAGSALEDMFDNTTLDGDPIDYNQQTNFLSEKVGPASGSGPYYQNALMLWGNHSNGTPPYSYDYPADPVSQFMGTIDAATQNGSEQVYIPLSSGLRPTTKVIVYDPDHPQKYNSDALHRPVILAYGPGLGDPNRAFVMLEASHNISGTGTASVAAQRAFFNFSFLSATAAAAAAAVPTIVNLPSLLYSGQTYEISFTVPPGTNLSDYTILWSSACGGTFNPPAANTQTVTFIPPVAPAPITCLISVSLTDICGRSNFDTRSVTVQCGLNVSNTVISPTCYGGTNGSISMTITGGTAPYNWTWNRTNPSGGPVSGSGTLISNLSAGTYSVTVTDASGCSGNFNALVNAPAQLNPAYSVTNVSCFGGSTGSINMTVTGGTPPYTYDWADIPGTSNPEDRPNVPAGPYTVNVTDSKGCTASASPVVGQPGGGLNLEGNITNVSCYGGSNGAITINVTGGTAPYNYDWADIAGTNNVEDRTGLIAGSYQVTVTDAHGCTAGQTFTVTQPANIVLTTQNTQPSCPPSAQQNYSNGAINLTVTGGTPGFTYSWVASNGGIIPSGQEDDEDLTGLVAGTYTVTVTDSKGCVKVLAVTLNYLNPNPVQPGSINN